MPESGRLFTILDGVTTVHCLGARISGVFDPSSNTSGMDRGMLPGVDGVETKIICAKIPPIVRPVPV
jgi:hypothetical protein